ncbi:hypothetical protein GSI_08414 [Ganoderma sinense ZZ0214-1]|uniref:Nephrocystin 3-like N-terminal domain-containing protein n=1 Tax=Ganoderma sinense ZZ0214-1 TaxID=1077348 RepID=A0A2G8S6R5_9APHY|nr:hypothetical protein GSI_08414 [Ganoderma sinense ZZ0214-1]
MPSSREIIDGILEWTKKALVLGQNVNSVVPIPAYGPISTVLVALIDQIATAQTNQRAAAAVLQQIQTLAKIVGQSKDTLDSGITSLSMTDLEKIESEIQDQTSKFKGPFDKFLEDLQQLNALSAGLKHKYGWLRLVFVGNDAEIIRQIQEGVSNATIFFETRCHVETLQYLRVIQDKVAEIHSTVKNTERVVNTQADRDILESLPRIDASYRASTNAEKGTFLEGTRSVLFAELERWIKGDLSDKPVCVLSGGAGTGKSTVASELARRLDGEGKLGASFFFTRGITDLDSTRVFFPTIAYQLANWNNGTLRQPIVDAVRKHLGKGTACQAMKYQASDLLHASLDDANKASPIYVVVDALDECTREASKLVPEMLDLLMTATEHGPLRIFLTSRPDPLIEYNLQYPKWTNIIHTISIVASSSDASHGGRRPDVAGHLARRAQGLFIYARTAVNFLGTYPGTLDEGVDYLLQGESEGVALSALDGLYLTVLTNAFPPDSLLKNPRLRERVQFFLACIALQKEPMTPQFLQSLTSPTHAPVTCEDGDSVLDRLRAVIIFKRGAPTEEFRPIHATFPQFLVDKTRCTNELYLVDPRHYHARIAEAWNSYNGRNGYNRWNDRCNGKSGNGERCNVERCNGERSNSERCNSEH